MRPEKLIFHIDVNSAFLSWSALERLRGPPGSLDLRTVPSVSYTHLSPHLRTLISTLR